LLLLLVQSEKRKRKREKEMPESEAGTPPVSAPPTPGTPAPLFTALRVDSLSYDRNSMPRCKCLPVNAPTWGQPHTCFTDFAAPDVSLTRKVPLSLSLSLSPQKSDFFHQHFVYFFWFSWYELEAKANIYIIFDPS
jgi:hypothetical protein